MDATLQRSDNVDVAPEQDINEVIIQSILGELAAKSRWQVDPRYRAEQELAMRLGLQTPLAKQLGSGSMEGMMFNMLQQRGQQR